MDDRAIIAAQIGREPRAFLRVVCRCPLGFPAVAEQTPYDDDGKPFPTGFYLTCPHLVSTVAQLEADGGVARWSRAVRKNPRLAWSLRRGNRKQRRRRKQLVQSQGSLIDAGTSLGLGIAGTGNRDRLKCLHAHVAFALANPGYTLGERIVEELQPLWPVDCRFRTRCRSRSGLEASEAEARGR